MKNEILRIRHLNYEAGRKRSLKNISFSIMEGEVTGMRGLDYSGKDLLVKLFTGEVEDPWEDCAIYLRGTKADSWQELRKNIHCIRSMNYSIGSWTVAEYIGLMDTPNQRWLFSYSKLEAEIRVFFEELGITLQPGAKISELTEIEKRIADLAKAVYRKAAVIVITDEFEGVSEEELRNYSELLKRFTKGRAATLITCYSKTVLETLSDHYLIFNHGRIVKKCESNFIRDQEHLEDFLLGEGADSYREKMSAGDVQKHNSNRGVFYKVSYIGEGAQRDFEAAAGEITTLLIINKERKEYIFRALSGEEKSNNFKYQLGDIECSADEFEEKIGRRVAAIRSLGSRDELFRFMSVEENLLLPSLGKLSFSDYFVLSGNMKRAMFGVLSADQADRERMSHYRDADEMTQNDRIRLTLERWGIYHPQVMLLYEPFGLCDIQGVEIVKQCLRRIASQGTAVIILKTRNENAEDLSDRVLRF